MIANPITDQLISFKLPNVKDSSRTPFLATKYSSEHPTSFTNHDTWGKNLDQSTARYAVSGCLRNVTTASIRSASLANTYRESSANAGYIATLDLYFQKGRMTKGMNVMKTDADRQRICSALVGKKRFHPKQCRPPKMTAMNGNTK